ncbi:hypothetical protein V2I01_42205 [Micromonospora sp. BRA006-A]|nr:hypothetical protein [Micromonospora sp. BRA006-A]
MALLPNQAGGVITSGYADRGFVDSAWNPPYYPDAYEENGFTGRFVSHTWICPVPPPTGPAPGLGVQPDGARLELHRGTPGGSTSSSACCADAQRLLRPARLLHADLGGAVAAADRRPGVPARRPRCST